MNESITARQYVEAVRKEGRAACLEREGVYWQETEGWAMERFPLFLAEPPPSDEVRSLLWRQRRLVATYLMPPDDLHPANAVLYLCDNRNYGLESLGARARRDIRRAQRAFRYSFIAPPQLAEHGAQAYCETRKRAGLSDGTVTNFQRHVAGLGANPAFRFVAAWHGDALAGYFWIMSIDDWAAAGGYAATEFLRLCPNEGLIHFVLDYCLAQGRFQVVSYGPSSMQEIERTATLDYFKQKVGFEARPVHRTFVFHPLVKPLANPVSYWILRGLVRCWPKNRILRKGAGMLGMILRQPQEGHG